MGIFLSMKIGPIFDEILGSFFIDFLTPKISVFSWDIFGTKIGTKIGTIFRS